MPTKQTLANSKWVSKNKEHAKYLSDRSRSRSFIKKQATLEDIKEFEQLLSDRKVLLKNQDKDA